MIASEEQTANDQVEKSKAPRGEDKPVTYIPVGSEQEITLTPKMVLNWIVNKTKSGKEPGQADVTRFIMLCKSSLLNPWVGDAYFLGYDSADGPQWSLITSIQALLKRAELNPKFSGLESGICVMKKGGEIIERPGSLWLNDEDLVGSWARCHRSDREIPFYDSLNLKVYTSGKSRWAKDPAGMIQKCARAAVLRLAFPSMAGCYLAEEFDSVVSDAITHGSQSRGTSAPVGVGGVQSVAKARLDAIISGSKPVAAITSVPPAQTFSPESASPKVSVAASESTTSTPAIVKQEVKQEVPERVRSYLNDIVACEASVDLGFIHSELMNDKELSDSDRSFLVTEIEKKMASLS